MPKRFERHARSKSGGWETSGSRSGETVRAVNDDPVRKSAPGRKDPGRCKGNRGGPHIPAIVLRDPVPDDEFEDRCRWSPVWSRDAGEDVAGWHCEHERKCVKCGLIFRSRIGCDDCPVYPGTPGQRAAAEQEAAAWNEGRRDREQTWRRKPVITGPQGFRRRRKDRAG
jgi:hypothetical protein